MTDLEFEQYLTAVIKKYNSNIEKAMIDSTPHEFSPEFERKMDILMGKSNKRSRYNVKSRQSKAFE